MQIVADKDGVRWIGTPAMDVFKRMAGFEFTRLDIELGLRDDGAVVWRPMR